MIIGQAAGVAAALALDMVRFTNSTSGSRSDTGRKFPSTLESLYAAGEASLSTQGALSPTHGFPSHRASGMPLPSVIE